LHITCHVSYILDACACSWSMDFHAFLLMGIKFFNKFILFFFGESLVFFLIILLERY
jgi:hypothetical protein